MKRVGIYSIALIMLLFTGISLSGCTVAHMALPQGLENESSEMTVEGRRGLAVFNSTMNFGPYNVTDIHREWTRGNGYSIFGFSSSEAKQKYEFSVNVPDRPAWKAQCATTANWKNLEDFLGGGVSVGFASSKQLVCTMEQKGGEESAKLVMEQTRHELVMQGVMTADDTRIDISVVYKVATSPFKLSDPTGYTFHIDGQPVGAVEIINKGTVWLNNSTTPEVRSALAATSTVLLLYQDVKKD
jgi:hypothetical protein